MLALGLKGTAIVGVSLPLFSACCERLETFAKTLFGRACVDLSLPAAISSIKAIRDHVNDTSGIHLKLPSEHAEEPGLQPDLRGYACDVTSEQQVKNTFASIVADFGKIDVVVTAAGIVENFEAENYEYDRWKRMLDVNLNGSWLWARESGKYWLKNGVKGNLIAVSSMSSMICVRPQKQVAYNAVSFKFLLALSPLGMGLFNSWLGIRNSPIRHSYPVYLII